MSMYQSIGTASDRVMEAPLAGLELEFGRRAGEALAYRFLKAQEADLQWDSRLEERWIGAYESPRDDDLEFDRIAIYGRLDGHWCSANMLVDGDSQPHGMVECRTYASLVRAREAMLRAY